MARYLVTGAAGFIGFHLARRLLADGQEVLGLDNLNPYYDVRLKRDRLALLHAQSRFQLAEIDLTDHDALQRLFVRYSFDVVYHLAAQAGVRHSIDHPHAYLDSNLAGTLEVLEGCRHSRVGHLVFASSSSVYGANVRQPFRESDGCDHPLSLYAATKRGGELLAHSYSQLFGLPVTGTRFFTVYGPWGRPDMALCRFTAAMLAGQPVPVYGQGKMRRAFTYVDDVVEALVRIGRRPPSPDPTWPAGEPNPATSAAPFRLYNVGSAEPVELLELLDVLQRCLGVTAQLDLLPAQPGDIAATCPDVSALARDFDFVPRTPLDQGLARFVAWYREYYADADLNGQARQARHSGGNANGSLRRPMEGQ